MPAEAVATGTAINCEDIGLTVDGAELLHDVDLRLTAGRTAVIGANGSGKSTFARMLNGLRLPTAGSLRVHGLDPMRDAKALRRHVGFVFTNPEAQLLMPTPAEDLALSLPGLSRSDRTARVARILAEYGLADRADVPVSELSGGQRQLLALASVLATHPGLVVADEPTTLLDLRNARRAGARRRGRGLPPGGAPPDRGRAPRGAGAVRFGAGPGRAAGGPAAVTAESRRSGA